MVYLCLLLVSCGNNEIRENSKQDSLIQENRDPRLTYKKRSVRLIPFSGKISYPRSKPRLQIEAANKEKFQKIFQVSEITMSYTCVFNHRGLPSSSSVDAVVPQRLYALINDEFEDGVGSNFGTKMCENERAVTLESVDVSVSIIEK
jgi:hypothetical protein